MKRLLRTLILVIALSSLSTTFVPSPASAVTASDWKAGRIIDDGIFANSNNMSVADIQNFLNSKVPNCDTNGTLPATEYGRSDLTHAQYAASRGWAAPPYVCLRNYYEVPKTVPGPGVPANNYTGLIPAGAISAAQMIYNAAQQNQINPKVLLVKLATESAGPLTTDTWPLPGQYTYAMGAHCPDSGPGGSANCDPNYSGFSIQISEAAGLMRWYLDSMTQSWWQYKKPYQTNSILWNVSSTGCGAGNVYIENKATAALYTYTPYQPNQAALNNMYGSAPPCGAYGNRNFWRVYSDWFGSTQLYQPVGGQLYFDQQLGGIYLVSSGVKYLFPSWDMLINYNVDKYPITPVNTSYLSSFADGGRVSNLVWDQSGVYLVNNGWRHHLNTEMCTAWGFACFDSSIVRDISPAFLEGHLPKNIDVPPIMVSGGNIFKMELGKKLPLLNMATFGDLGYTSNQALGVNPLDATQPLGPLLITRPTIIKFPGSPKVYYYDGQSYHHIPNPQTLEAWGINNIDIVLAPPSIYDNQDPPQGDPLSIWASDGTNKYIVDKGRKLLIPSTLMGLWPGIEFQTYSSELLKKIPSVALAELVSNGSTAYYLDTHTGTKRLLQSQEDRIEFGYNSTSSPLIVSDSLLQTIPEGSVGLANGSLLISDDQSGISVISDNQRLIIPDNETFADFGFSYANVRTFSSSQLSSYPIAGNLSHKVKNPYGYYYFYKGKGVEINHTQAYDMGIKPAEYQTIATKVVARARPTTPATRFLYDDTDGRIYYGSGQAIHYVTTTNAFKAYGGNYGTVMPGTRDFINSFLLAQPV